MTDSSDHEADAIRYAVLRKLASGMRHALVGELQALQFSAELAARSLEAGANEAKLAEYVRQMPDQSRAAVAVCRSMIAWLRPERDASTTVGEAVQECLRVAGDDWSLRGIATSTDFKTGDARVSTPALREPLVTALLALADIHAGPIDLVVSAGSSGNEVVVTVSAKRVERKSPFPPLTLYRALGYDDVATISRAHDVGCSCGDGMVTLRLKVLPARV